MTTTSPISPAEVRAREAQLNAQLMNLAVTFATQKLEVAERRLRREIARPRTSAARHAELPYFERQVQRRRAELARLRSQYSRFVSVNRIIGVRNVDGIAE